MGSELAVPGEDPAVVSDLDLSSWGGALQDPPQWVIMGVLMKDGSCAVLASSTLTRAEMRRRAETYLREVPGQKPWRLAKETTAVGFLCDGFTMIRADSYRDALASLGTVWQPPEQERPALAAHECDVDGSCEEHKLYGFCRVCGCPYE